MRPRMVYQLVLLGWLAGLASGQAPAPPRPLPAAWATSGDEAMPPATAPPAVIASSKTGRAVLPAEARMPLPDDALPLTTATPSASSGAVRPPALMPPMPATPPPQPNTVRPAVYLPKTDSPPPPPRSPGVVPASAVEPADTRPPLQPIVEGASPRAGSVLSVEVVGPDRTAPGQAVACQLVIRNVGTLVVGGVHVELPVPPGLRILVAKPDAERKGDRLGWQLGNLEAGAERRIDLEVLATQPGELHLGPQARFTAAMAWRSNVVRPPFALTVSCADTVIAGEKVVLQIQLGNHTNEPIRRVSLRCELSAGLFHPQGQVIEADLGEDLAPGQVRTIQLDAQASQAGRKTATLQATADSGQSAQAVAGVQVSEPTLGLTMQGPRRSALGQDLNLQLEVRNPGKRSLGPVRVTQALPQGVVFLSASTGGTYNPAVSSITWVLNELAAEQRQTVTFVVRAREAGDYALAASVEAEGRSATRATHAVQIEATPSASLELTAGRDPLEVGHDTTYEMRVYNAGPAVAHGLRLVVHVPENLTPVHGDGPTTWQIRGQQVYFEPLAELRGKADAVYRLRVRGARPGQGRFRVEAHAAGLSRPMQQELTSHVQAAQAAAR